MPIEKQLREFFKANADALVCAYLFGSYARGEEKPDSDVDVAVLYTKPPPSTLEGLGLRLEGELESSLGKAVDLVVLNRAPVDLIHRVLRDGILLFDQNTSARIRFEVKARNEYFDLLPFLRQYRAFAADSQL